MFIIEAIFITILGSIIGSFISMLNHRIENNLPGIFLGRSECPKCKKQLGIKNLIPILSYFYQKGKCAFCHKKIPKSYIYSELVTATIFLLTYLQLRLNLELSWITTIFWLIIFSFAIAISFYDIKTKEIPFKLSAPLGVISLIGSIFILNLPIAQVLLGAVIGFGFFYLQYFVSKGTWTGLGDADIALIIGICLGPIYLGLSLITSYILGSLYGIYLLVSKQANAKTQLAFGPFLFIGLFTTVLWGKQLANFLFQTNVL